MLEAEVFCMIGAVKDLITKLIQAGLNGFPFPGIQAAQLIVKQCDHHG